MVGVKVSLLGCLILSQAHALKIENQWEESSPVDGKNETVKKCKGVKPLKSCMANEYDCGFVWLHGIGSTAVVNKNNQEQLIPRFLESYKKETGMTCLVVFPQAPTAKVTSLSWLFDVKVQSWHDQEKDSYDVHYKPPSHGYSFEEGFKNVKIVHQGIDQLVALGLPPSKIIVAGTSQGGTMVYLSSLTYPQSLGGAINLSGGLLGHWKIKELIHPANAKLPMLWMKGDEDTVVPQAAQDEILPFLRSAGLKVDLDTWHGGHYWTDAHGSLNPWNQAIIPKMTAWMAKKLHA